MSPEPPSGGPRYAVACIQTDFPCPKGRDEIGARVGRMLELIDSAVEGYRPFFPVRLLVFPEFAHAAPIYPTARELLERLAVPIPSEHTDRYIARAKRHGAYIQTGTFLEADPRWPGVVFNTTCLIGPEGILARYRKTHPWIPWEVCASPHDVPGYDDDPFPVARTPIGNIGAAICYDWLFPEAIRQLAANGAEVLARVSAYMDPWGAVPPMDWWTVVNRARAIENLAYVAASNQGARLRNYPPFSWPGGSMVVDFDGRILAQADPGPGEKIVVGEIDIGALRAARSMRLGHRGVEHLRTELYPVYRSPAYPGGRFPAGDPAGDRTVEENERTIRERLPGSPRNRCEPGGLRIDGGEKEMLELIAMVAASLSRAPDAEPYREVLTSAERGIHLASWQISHHEVDPKSPVPWSIRKYTLHGGRQEGVDAIVLENGRLAITVIPTRGMGILKVEMGDVRLGWDSPIKEVVHPSTINLQSRGGLGWLEGFNEFLVRCGLEFAGHPGKDKFVNNMGDEAEMDLTVHGRIANIPASEVEVVVDREAPRRLRIRGRVDERAFFGPKLELWTEISTEPGSSEFRVEDAIANRGGLEQEFQVIYHSNYGPPLLEEGSRFVGALKQVTPFNAHAAEGVDRFAEYSGPRKGAIEKVYCMVPYGDKENRTIVMLQNGAADRGVSMKFSLLELPYFGLWKNLIAQEDGYVTGLEPSTGFAYNRRIERKFGRVPKLAPGEARRFKIDYGILVGKDQVERVAGEIGRIQAGRTTQVDAEPPRIE